MSAVIINIDDLEFVWRAAGDGFSAGVDFKTWLANTVVSYRARIDALESTQKDIKEFFAGAVEYAEEMRGSCERTETELQKVVAERDALRKQLATYERMKAVRQ